MALAGETVTRQFTLRRLDTGVKTDADSLPTGVLVRNGEDTAETVTVTNVDTGVYKAAVTLPSSYNAGDEVEVRITATVNSITDDAIIWQDSIVATLVTSAEIDDLDDISGDAITESQLRGLVAKIDIRLYNILHGNGTYGGAAYEERGDVGFRIDPIGLVRELRELRKHYVDMLRDAVMLNDVELVISQWDDPSL